MVDMTNRDYKDPVDFERGKTATGGPLLFPCNTQYMVYRPSMHRYHLTGAGLIQNGIEFTDFMGDKDINRFLELVSKKVYDYIWQCVRDHRVYQTMMYRIATAPTVIYPSQYYMRRQFEQALVAQARFLLENDDTSRVSRAYTGRDGQLNLHMKDRNDGSIDVSDIAPETIRTLEALDLTRWFRVHQHIWLDPTKY